MPHRGLPDVKSHAKTAKTAKSAKMTEDEIARVIVDAAIKVHRVLGPGLLESAYESAMAHELSTRGLRVARQIGIPVVYDGIDLGEGFRVDLSGGRKGAGGT